MSTGKKEVLQQIIAGETRISGLLTQFSRNLPLTSRVCG
jgi:hypothetical protein